jgi:hypothetical protein
MSEGDERTFRGIWNEVKTVRGLQNKSNEARAINCLVDRRGFAWLGVTTLAAMSAGRCKPRLSVLAELGRIKDDDTLRQIARDLCRAKPTTARWAVRAVRRWRTGRAPAGDVASLSRLLAVTAETYRREHADVSYADLRAALAAAADQLPDEGTDGDA